MDLQASFNLSYYHFGFAKSTASARRLSSLPVVKRRKGFLQTLQTQEVRAIFLLGFDQHRYPISMSANLMRYYPVNTVKRGGPYSAEALWRKSNLIISYSPTRIKRREH
jgi:hypothetical protein